MARVIDSNIWPQPQDDAGSPTPAAGMPDPAATTDARAPALSPEQIKALNERFGPVDLGRLHHQPARD